MEQYQRGGERGISQKKQEILFQAKIRRVFATSDLFGENVCFTLVIQFTLVQQSS